MYHIVKYTNTPCKVQSCKVGYSIVMALFCYPKSAYMVTTDSNGQEKTVRNLKVYDKLFRRGGRVVSNHHSVLYPEIRLIGKWLQDCGFEPGQQIEVITEHNKLIIRHSEASH
jgi:hypothetical protein